MEYSYPLREDWATEEIVNVIAFFELIEQAYESGVGRDELLEAYRLFKVVVPSKSEEKTLFKEFERASEYNSYRVVKKAREEEGQTKITM